MKKDIETDLISVIVPIFNVEAYLRPCIESILASTYTTLQIILVNDGSTDHSGEICDEYTRKDTRIEVIHQKNAGLSPARNSGMKFGKAFQDDNQREVSCVKHALPASGTPYSEKTKKANSQRVPEKQTYPLSYKTFTPQFLLHSAPVQRIHETVRDKSTKKIT